LGGPIRLAQRYRPASFDAVIGQESVITVLKAIVKAGRHESAYLFSGPAGTGKTTLGRIFSMAMLCDAPVESGPCCACESCRLFLKEQNFAYTELDAATYSGKEDMIKLRDDAAFTSMSKKKIILLDECHDISKQGQDSLLKQVEQCPSHLVYIFCTTDPDKMLPTLRDRCMQFQISRLDSALIAGRIKKICEEEKISYEDEALASIADKADGHVRNAVNLLEEVAYLGPVTVTNLSVVSKDHDGHIFAMIAALGSDLNLAMAEYRQVSSYLSPGDLYARVISLVNDACRVLHGFDGFPPQRLQALLRLRDVHGFSLMEFLNYLITRDKFIDRIGMQSDIIVLHHKFNAKQFTVVEPPRLIRMESPQTPQIQQAAQPQTAAGLAPREEKAPALSYTHIARLPEKEKSRTLREMRSAQVQEKEDPSAKVPSEWPLPKDYRPGASSSDDGFLSPQDFSKLLVGGRKIG